MSAQHSYTNPEAAAGNGIVSGRVALAGVPPERRKLDLSANPTCERQHLRAVYSEDVLVSKKGGLRNTLVWVKSGLPANHWPAPTETVKLNQVGCIYEPHVLALMTGQTLEVSNADPLNHNVHAEATVNTPFNVAQPPRAEKLFQKFDKQETMVPITCGVHGWMRAYVSVIDHPFFAVTDEDGRFEIKGLPPGDFTVEAIHETYGRLEHTAAMRAQTRATVDFTYPATAR